MEILVIGSGAREHALVTALQLDKTVGRIICAPGNAGIARDVETREVDATSAQAISDLAAELRVDLVVIGPEVPLVAGAADAVRAHGIACFGPSAAAAQLEGSKAFAKQVMDEVNKEKKGLVATWEGGYRINSKGYGKEIHEALGDAERQTQGAMKAYETAISGARDSVNIQRESALRTHAGNVGLANQGIAATQNLWTRHLNDMRTAFQQGVQNNSAGIGALVQSGALVFSGKVNK